MKLLTGAPHLWPHPSPSTAPKPHLQTSSHWELGLHHMNFEDTKHPLHNKSLWDQHKEGIQVLDQVGEVIKQTMGKELELKLQREWQSLASNVQVPNVRWSWEWREKPSSWLSLAVYLCPHWMPFKVLNATHSLLPPNVLLGIFCLLFLPNHTLTWWTPCQTAGLRLNITFSGNFSMVASVWWLEPFNWLLPN